MPNSSVIYAPFGEIRQGAQSGLTDFGYTGQRLDGSTGGLMYYGARYYLPGLRRFISADTIVPQAYNAQALNRYSYVYNNPIKFTDPSGHCAQYDGETYDCIPNRTPPSNGGNGRGSSNGSVSPEGWKHAMHIQDSFGVTLASGIVKNEHGQIVDTVALSPGNYGDWTDTAIEQVHEAIFRIESRLASVGRISDFLEGWTIHANREGCNGGPAGCALIDPGGPIIIFNTEYSEFHQGEWENRVVDALIHEMAHALLISLAGGDESQDDDLATDLLTQYENTNPGTDFSLPDENIWGTTERIAGSGRQHLDHEVFADLFMGWVDGTLGNVGNDFMYGFLKSLEESK